MRLGSLVLALALLAGAPGRAFAEWQVKPFMGVTFGGGTDLVADLEHAVGGANFVVGGDVTWLGEILGLEADLGYSPGFFDRGDQNLVLKSRVTTFTGNVVIAMPRRMTEYTLRPYFVAGGGLMQASTSNSIGVLELSKTFGAIDVGGGATGFVSQSFGYSWDVRYFTNANSKVDPGLSQEGTSGKLSFWRATMAFAFRY